MKKIILGAGILILLGAVLFTVVHLTTENSSLQNNLNSREREISSLYSIVQEYSKDINEIRKKLSLPEKNYLPDTFNNTSADESKPDIGETRENEDLPFFLAADKLITFNVRLNNLRILKNFAESDALNAILLKNRLKLIKNGDSGYHLLLGGSIAYTLSIYNDSPLEAALSYRQKETEKKTFNPVAKDACKIVEEAIDSSIHEITAYIAESKALSDKFSGIVQEKRVAHTVDKYGLVIKTIHTADTRAVRISTKDGRLILTAEMDKNKLDFTLNGESYNDFNQFHSRFMEVLDSSDKRSAEELVIEKSKNKIITVAKDPAFITYLKEKNLTLRTEIRDDSDYYYFDFVNSSGEKQGSLGVQKKIGEIYLFDKEDVVISSLKSLTMSSEAETTPGSTFIIPDTIADFGDKYGNNGSLTLLLIGSHEKNADTIILANFNSSTDTIKLISIPRDLFYQNRKINDYYRTGGGELFTEIISEITGVEISGYIGVDMYAFIDIINILGGIDIELASDLADPTYKIRDNGVWTTLYYSKGKHHLNGLEALRIARSRHTSSDFGRSDRQQLILKGVKDKLNELNVTEMNKVYSIFKTLDEYLDTNIPSMEMISIFLKYKNAEIEKKDGLSVFNVLYNTYSNIHSLKDKSLQYEEGFNRGAWILLPRNDDWNVIKWYINGLLNE